jgi:hypothetical protein
VGDVGKAERAASRSFTPAAFTSAWALDLGTQQHEPAVIDSAIHLGWLRKESRGRQKN